MCIAVKGEVSRMLGSYSESRPCHGDRRVRGMPSEGKNVEEAPAESVGKAAVKEAVPVTLVRRAILALI